MKLLLDENLSRRLLEAIHDLFPGSVHVTQVGLSSGTPDRKIWDYATPYPAKAIGQAFLIARPRSPHAGHKVAYNPVYA